MLFGFLQQVLPYGLAVRIPGFHPGGPGSTPGMGITCFLFFPQFENLTEICITGEICFNTKL